MTTLREAAQQALEALMDAQRHNYALKHKETDDLITALRAALAEPDYWQEEARRYAGNADYWRKRYEALAAPGQEPVHEHEKWCASVTQLLLCDPPRKAPCNCKPTAPPQRKPLTDEEIRDLWSWSMTAEAERTASTQQHAFARAIERAHGIGGEVRATLTKPCGSLGEDVSLCRYPDCVGGQAGTICNNWCPGCR